MAKKIKINNIKKSHKITTVMTASHERTVILSRKAKKGITTIFAFYYIVGYKTLDEMFYALCLTMFR